MPIYGTRDVAPLLGNAPLMARLDAEPYDLHRVEVLQVMFEIESRGMEALLPKALHPTIPPTITFVVWRSPDGPDGAFNLAQVRIGCRAGVRPRGFPVASFCDNEAATRLLRDGWGYNCEPASVRLRHLHDRAIATVERDGNEILQVQIVDPQYISGADVQYVANMNLARVQQDGSEQPRLVQVDPEFTFHRAERGQPQVVSFDREACHAEGINTVYPVSATIAIADITLPRLRYTTDPDIPALQGTKTIAHAT